MGRVSKRKLIQKRSRSIKTGGGIYIWDINKEIGKLFNNKIRVIYHQKRLKSLSLRI